MINLYTYNYHKSAILKCSLLLLLVILFYKTNYAQSNKVEDSLKLLVMDEPNDSIKISLYNKLRRATYSSDPVKSTNYIYLMLELATKNKDSFNIAIANYYLGNANVRSSGFVEALQYYLKAAVYFEKKEDLVRLSSIYNGIAAAYENNGNDSLSLKYFEKSFALSKKEGNNRKLGIALNNISNIYKNRGEIDKAITYLEKGVEYLKDPSLLVYYKTISLNLANAYFEANNYQQAKTIYNDLLPKIDTINDVYNYAIALRGLGNVLISEKNSIKGQYYLKKSFDKFTKHNFDDERYETMRDLVDAYYLNKNYKEALNLYYEFNIIKDSIFNSEKDKNLTYALQKYETVKKDKEILNQNLVIEKKEAEKKQMILGLIGLGIVSIGLFIFFKKRIKYQKTIAEQDKELQRQKITDLQQKNKLLALNSMIEGQEAERLRIAKDLHDSLGGLLSTVKNHFTVIQKEIEQIEQLNLTKKTNELIDEACHEVRRISHNMIPHALHISGLKGAIEDLGEQLNNEGYNTTVSVNDQLKDIEETKKAMMYRLIQEIISNIRKHAEAKNIFIQILVHENELNLMIEDDGIGFDFKNAIDNGGLGLKSINSRVEFLDGTIDWDSQIDNGTTVTITIPI